MRTELLTQAQAEKVLLEDKKSPQCTWPDVANWNSTKMAISIFVDKARKERAPHEILLVTGAKLLFRNRIIPGTHRRITLSGYAHDGSDLAPYLAAINP